MATIYDQRGLAQRQEMDVISEAWALLSPLDTAARCRVLEWLGSWVRHEEQRTRDINLDF